MAERGNQAALSFAQGVIFIGAQLWYYKKRVAPRMGGTVSKGALATRFIGFGVANLYMCKVFASVMVHTPFQSAQERNIQEEILFGRMMQTASTGGPAAREVI